MSAQTKAYPQDRGSIFHQAFEDGIYLASQTEFYALIGGLAAGPVLFRSTFDSESNSINVKLNESPNTHRFFKLGHWFGQATFHAGAGLLNMGVGKVSGSNSIQSFGSDLVRAQWYNAVVTMSMKVSINRKRPNGAPYSFPSGHTSTSFATAGIVYSNFGKVWGTVALLGASYVGVSRLEQNEHYLSDVISGAIIGSYIGLSIGHRSSLMRRVTIAPIAPSARYDSGGLMLSLQL